MDASFGMQQAQQCNRTFYFSVQTGDRLMELLQAGIILTWYYYGSGRSVDVKNPISINIANINSL